LNRATITAAYELLEADGLISGQVGRGSYVQSREISCATSRPSEELFPVDEFRAVADEVIQSNAGQILQLGSPMGYGPLREFLAEEAQAEGVFDPAADDLLITSGCQQALDLIQRTLVGGAPVWTEEPVYPGLRHAFTGRLTPENSPQTGARVVTPNFANPTGRTMTMAEREAALGANGPLLIEIDIYSRLRYEGANLPPLRALDAGKRGLLLRSFSKIAFPGLRVGWVIGPREAIQRHAQAKQWTDLHSDQLSQAIMFEFARSGRLAAHLERVLDRGRMALRAAVDGLERSLPEGASFTRPEGGMNLWVTLPNGCDAEAVLERARREQVSFLAGRQFSLRQPFRESLRLSFAGLAPARIEEGLRRLAPLFAEEAARASRGQDQPEPVAEMAMV
jgi:2-aminoadipate transaminase